MDVQGKALDIIGLTKQYRDFTLDSVSFAVPYGSVVGFIGENGAGKSTTLKTILGLVIKDAGTISVLGKREQDIDCDRRRPFTGSTASDHGRTYKRARSGHA